MWKRPRGVRYITSASAWANGLCPRGLFWQFCQLTRQYSVSVMASAPNTQAFNALFNDIKANSREVQSLSSAEYFSNRVPIVEFLTKLRAKGNFVSSLGLTSVEDGGKLRLSADGRATIWFSCEDWESNIVVSKSISQRMASLCGDTNYRTEPNGGVQALNDCLGLLTKAFVGMHKQTGATMVAV